MASAFGHSFAAFMIGRSANELREQETKLPWRFWLLTVICSVLPDADTLGLAFGVEYGSMWGHRGFTHSILFAIVLSAIVVYFFFRKELQRREVFAHPFWLFGYFFLVTISHGLLDACTTGGRGVGFFIPFSAERYFFPIHPIKVSPISAPGFFNARGVMILESEAEYIGIGFLAQYLLVLLYTRLVRRSKKQATASQK